MNVMHINQWLNDREVKAICWTLIHSLWQGLLVAAIAGLVIAATRKASARVRYQLFCALLVLFMLLIGCTLIYEIGWNQPVAPGQTINDTIITRSSAPYSPVSGRANLLHTTAAFLNNQAAGIFAVWLICFLYKSVKLLGGIFYIRRIRKQRTVPVTGELTDKVMAFARRIGIPRQVAIIQSELIKVPVTLGYFKPLIVLPAGIILQLSAEQVETILWHELAHIRRRDYLVNILQSIVEAIFFFNPAILWLSALIREEREACCDDIVLANVQQKGSYLEALMAFQGQYASVGSLAMALSLRPNQLMNRLRRMVYQENKKLSIMEMGVLLCGLLLFSAFTFIPQARPALKSSVAFIKKTIAHTFPESQPQELPARKYHASVRPHNDTDTAANTNTIVPADNDTAMVFKSIRFNQSNADRANREMNVVDGQNNKYHILIVEGRLTTLQVNGQSIAGADFDHYPRLIEQIDAALDDKKRQVSGQLASRPNSVKKHWIDSVQRTPATPSKKRMEPNGLNPAKKHWIDSVQAIHATAPKKQTNLKWKADTAYVRVNNPPQKHRGNIDITADQARVRGVIRDLVNARIVASAADVESFGLSDTELMVNGHKQPQALQQKLMETYGIKPHYGLYYGQVQTRASGVILNKGDL